MASNKTIQTESKACKMRSATGYCPRPLEIASAYLSKKWTISIIITIGNFETLRFNEIERKIEGITAKILTSRLKELKEEKILNRTAHKTIPPKVEYSLTKKGIQLMNALIPLINWAEK